MKNRATLLPLHPTSSSGGEKKNENLSAQSLEQKSAKMNYEEERKQTRIVQAESCKKIHNEFITMTILY